MELSKYFRSIVDVDKSAVVICNLEHEIIYMNPAAVLKYKAHGGNKLVGSNLLDCHSPHSCDKIKETVEYFSKHDDINIVFTGHNNSENKDLYIVALRDDNNKLIGYYEKHEYRTAENSKPYDFEHEEVGK